MRIPRPIIRRYRPALLAIWLLCASGAAFGRSHAHEAMPELPRGGAGAFRDKMLSWEAPAVDQARRGLTDIHLPVETLRYSSHFGARTDPFSGDHASHAGVDIPGPAGAPILAALGGRVTVARRAGGYGNMIEIDHGNGVRTRYAHLLDIMVAPDEWVERGAVIASLGSTGRSTGNHLHFELRKQGLPQDPAPYLSKLLQVDVVEVAAVRKPMLSSFALSREARPVSQ